MLQILNPHDLNTRRNIGAYYTSRGIAAALAEWAIRTPETRVLEPSFGGGALLEAALARLYVLGSNARSNQVVGYDTDRNARALLDAALSRARRPHLITEDFLSVTPPPDENKFHCVIANPPFVRHHRNKDDLFKSRCERLGLPKSSDLSCLFVMHALSFLKRGGRMALVLPASFLFADYARTVRDALQQRFGHVKSIRLAFNSFADSGADERGVLILADEFDADHSASWVETVAWAETDLPEIIQSTYQAPSLPNIQFDCLTQEIEAIRFEELARLQIGAVTGANRFFVVNDDVRKHYRLPLESLIPIAARTSQISGLKFGMLEHGVQARANQRVWLLSPKTLGRKTHPVRRYLETVPAKIREETLWFRKRPHWFRPEPIFADAIFTYMNHLGPRIALLSPRITATNTFHLVTLQNRSNNVDKYRITLGLLSSLSQASAEIQGRAYGGGLLKLEPAGVRRIALPRYSPPLKILRDAFQKADALLRAGDTAAARDIADQVLLYPSISKNPESVVISLHRLIDYSRQIRNTASK
ncbi:N-6 DNA methylase [Bradyrhizobium manausense]|uniref:HsdM family class I SAM-dependent methyltransferase n=1 Tax=Bradyrhizobium manausense TaxID=989370 RepID=UPI001BAD2557|nr:N-6 DNA methylase [Bradyrhizobium manausense]MBR0835471.1 N-6 DNA methylase [Bradyrhizobium manausense]